MKKKKINPLCACGHYEIEHFCLKFHKKLGKNCSKIHKAICLGVIENRMSCQCDAFKVDNLSYIEQVYNNEQEKR